MTQFRSLIASASSGELVVESVDVAHHDSAIMNKKLHDSHHSRAYPIVSESLFYFRSFHFVNEFTH